MLATSHLWRRDLAPGDYTVPTPDGRPATRTFAGERLARVVCADCDMLDDAAVSSIADAIAAAQVARIAENLSRVLARHPSLQVAVVTGLGAFLAEAAARRCGLRTERLAAQLGEAAARCAPAAAVALLLEQALSMADRSPVPAPDVPSHDVTRLDVLPQRSARTVGISASALGTPVGTRHGFTRSTDGPAESPRDLVVDTVVKLGGGVLADVRRL